MSTDAEPEQVVSAAANHAGIVAVTQRGAVVSLSFMMTDSPAKDES